jgi:hypothetical protein
MAGAKIGTLPICVELRADELIFFCHSRDVLNAKPGQSIAELWHQAEFQERSEREENGMSEAHGDFYKTFRENVRAWVD